MGGHRLLDVRQLLRVAVQPGRAAFYEDHLVRDHGGGEHRQDRGRGQPRRAPDRPHAGPPHMVGHDPLLCGLGTVHMVG